MKKLSLLLALALCVITACSDKSSSDKKQPAGEISAAAVQTGTPKEVVEKTIKRYNQLLAEGYQKLNMTNLQEVTTEKLALDAYYHASALTEGGSKMVSKLNNIDFIKVDFDQPGKCRVVTKENWDFAYVDIKTGEKKQEVKDYIYHVAYALDNKTGKWMINEISATGEERKEMPSWNKIYENAGKPSAGQQAGQAQPAGQQAPAAQIPAGQMPPGHPQMPGGQMPAGHPQMPAGK